ncbi:hypothetical protein V5O48_000780 [Marasmius crinis-equi]|uniref:Uncharacterized protein n=1 Tax=Marasmius crinis-equi TaxID=585013 RepID=A0ABR3G0D2_9AGAR
MPSPTTSTILLLTFLAVCQNVVATGTDFQQCLLDVQNNTYGDIGLNNAGHPVPNADATAISYRDCVKHCGSGPTSFNWSTFAQEFSGWLLPYLALLSQLPFGAHDRWDNLIAVLLTVGSPALAAYSIVITVLNGRWIARLFSPYSYPNSRQAVRILSSLQQSSLSINPDGCLLSSLVVVPENDEWWNELVVWLDYAHSWSISAVSSIAWVVVAYIFTVIDSFTDNLETTVEVNGQAVGSIWLWLIPVVVAWLQISPKCDAVKVRQALDRANEIAYVATYDHTAVLASRLSSQRAIRVDIDRRQMLRSDQYISAPVYNYARVFTWTEVVQKVAACFSEATRHADLFEPVNPDMEWVEGDRYVKVRPQNRSGASFQVETYCTTVQPSQLDHFESGVWSRMTLGILAALGLQWGTAGAAVLTVYHTPTTGLGCRSGAYILYALISSIVMVMLVLSSILADYATTYPSQYPIELHPRSYRVKILAWGSILLRRLGKVFAVLNALLLTATCVFQFTGFFDRCYCDSSVIGRGADNAFNVIKLLPGDVSSMRDAWIGGVVLAIGSSLLFVVYINLMIKPKLL